MVVVMGVVMIGDGVRVVEEFGPGVMGWVELGC